MLEPQADARLRICYRGVGWNEAPMKLQRIATAPDAGFTLLELLVTLAIVALALSVALPNLTATREPGLRPLAAQLTAEMKRARVASIGNGTPVAVILIPQTHSLQVQGSTRSIALPRGTALTWTMPRDTLKTTDSSIVFYPDGTATGGELVLQDTQGQKVVLVINPVTGTVSQATR